MSTEEFRLSNLLWAGGTLIFIFVTSVALGWLARQIARWRGANIGTQRNAFYGFAFAGPWITGFFIFVLGPALVSLYYSFTNYKLGDPIQWIGLQNFQALLLQQGTIGRQFSQAMFNSFYYALIGVPLQISAALGMAMLLNREIKGIKIFRTIFYLPVILAGGPALLLAWRFMLNGNGGIVNLILQKFAQSFFVFGWLYRGFIFIFEAVNGFYTGISRGDVVGPLAFTLPALLGIVIFLRLALGEWTEGKRVLSWRTGQLVGLLVLYVLGFQTLVASPTDISWTLVGGVLCTLFIYLNAKDQKIMLLRVWQIAGICFFGGGIVLTLIGAQGQLTADRTAYLIAEIVGLIPILITLFGKWTRSKVTVVGISMAVLSVVVFIRLIPGQLDGGRLGFFFKYLTFQSIIQDPTNNDYLTKTLPTQVPSPLWIYALVAGLATVVALLHKRDQARRILSIAALAFFALFAVNSLVDGRNYFQAFADNAKVAGTPVYHFALFRQATTQFPGMDRVPLWMTNELWTKPALVLITAWSSGTGMLIFLAALKGVPKSLYEAADVDGANALQKFMKITLPMISPALFYNLVIGIIAALQTFDAVYILQAPQTVDGIKSAAYFLYTRTFNQLAIGEGSAASWILVVIILTVTVIQFRYSGWVNYES